MSENSINAISSVRSAEASPAAELPQVQSEAMAGPRAGAPAQVKPVAQAQVEALAQAEAAAAPKLGAPAESKPIRAEDKAALPISNGSNVTIHFKVDEKTNALTVFVVDRKSKRVLRSIPPGELGKLQAGDLLKLTA